MTNVQYVLLNGVPKNVLFQEVKLRVAAVGDAHCFAVDVTAGQEMNERLGEMVRQRQWPSGAGEPDIRVISGASKRRVRLNPRIEIRQVSETNTDLLRCCMMLIRSV